VHVFLAQFLAAQPALAVTARWSFVDAYDNVNDGDWYHGYDNESATLAWGESYVMMGLAAMFRATGDPSWLERLAWHADGVLAQRDDARGVTDYRGVSGACWRNSSYQDGDYCYAVHSGMLAYPMAEFARLVQEHGLGAETLSYDGGSFEEKAADFVAAARETVACHDDQYDSAGYYIFRSDASFLGYPGVDLPLNQSNAMGRLLLALYQVTGEAEYLDKATGLAARFKDQISTDSGGAYLWNYWGGSYSAPGEDVSHAAINVDFAAMCAEAGVVFDQADLEGFATTLTDIVLVDDRTTCDSVGGGSTNGSSYQPQLGRWLRLTPVRTGVYTGVRNLFDLDYPASAVGSGSILAGWGLLAEHEPLHCAPVFYYVDWTDEDPEDDSSWRQATAYGANILTLPPDFGQGCMLPLQVDLPRETELQQWDGAAYHAVASFQATGGETARFMPYDTRWPYEYWSGMQPFQLADSFVEGDGPRVRENPGLILPLITSSPPDEGLLDEPVVYVPEGTGDAPFWWSLAEFPTGARVDAATGELSWTPSSTGSLAFTLRLENDAGSAEQAFEILVATPGDTAAPPDSDTPDDSGTQDSGPGFPPGDTTTPDDTGCSCSAGGRGLGSLLALLCAGLGLVSQRRRSR